MLPPYVSLPSRLSLGPSVNFLSPSRLESDWPSVSIGVLSATASCVSMRLHLPGLVICPQIVEAASQNTSRFDPFVAVTSLVPRQDDVVDFRGAFHSLYPSSRRSFVCVLR